MPTQSPQMSLDLTDVAAPEPARPLEERAAMAVAGLFAGIGGIELGLATSGHRASILCEIDPGARAVLASRFPESPLHDDIRTLPKLPKDVDLVTAGFPCQDLSQAGRTRGITGSNSGLIGHVFDRLRERPVPWLLLENVPFMLQLGRGAALEIIVKNLEDLGYRWAYRVVDTRAFGLPQRRQRVYLLASQEGDPTEVLLADDAGEPELPTEGLAYGFYWTEGVRGLGWAVDSVPTLKGGSTVGVPSPPAIWMPNGLIVTPDIRDAERLQGFRRNWTRPAERATRPTFRWKLVGNAVSVPVARWIGRRLRRPDTPLTANRRRLPQGVAWPKVAWNVNGQRYTGPISAWPKRYKIVPIHEFLREPPRPLSARATAGFYERTRRSHLRFRDGFLSSISAHLRRLDLDGEVTPSGRRRSRHRR